MNKYKIYNTQPQLRVICIEHSENHFVYVW